MQALPELARPPPAGATGPTSNAWSAFSAAAKQGFRRSSTDKMLSGVCSGFARYIGVDPVWVRLFYAVATIFTAGFPGVILYVILAYVVPSDDAVLGG